MQPINSPLAGALHFAEQGFPVFPIQRQAKYPPLVKNWPDVATTDEKQILEWAEAKPMCNWGCHPDGNEFDPHVVIDCDGAKGLEEGRELLGDDYDNAPTFRTPNGGLHKLYRGSYPSTVKKIASSVDTRGQRGYIVLPGSNADGGAYTMVHGTPALSATVDLPAHVGAAIDAARSVKRTTIAREISSSAARQETAGYLQESYIGVYGEDGDHTAFVTACMCRDLGITDEAECLDLMLEHWAPRCNPPWGADELEVKVRNAYKFAKNEHAGSKLAPSAAETFTDCSGDDFTEAPKPKPVKHLAYDAEDCADFDAATMDFPNDFVEGLLVEGEMSVVYGPSNVGKSFFVLDLAHCVGSGTPWRGLNPTDQTNVIYLPKEGGAGTRARHAALKLKGRAAPKGCVYSLTDCKYAFGDDQGLGRLIQTIKEKEAGFVIIDTLAAAMAGTGADENSADGIGVATNAAQAIIIATGAHVMLVHHTGKAVANGMRGSSALPSSAESTIELARQIPDDRETPVIMRVQKQRNIDFHKPCAFEIETMVIAERTKPSGRVVEVTNCVLNYYDDAETEALLKAAPADGEKAPSANERRLPFLIAEIRKREATGEPVLLKDLAGFTGGMSKEAIYRMRKLPNAGFDIVGGVVMCIESEGE